MKNKISLKWKIAKYFLIFGAVTLAVMFVFQMKFLEPMYEEEKISSIKGVAEEIIDELDEDTDDLMSEILEESMRTDTCIVVASTSDGMFEGQRFSNMGCELYRMRPDELMDMTQKAKESPSGENLSRRDKGMHDGHSADFTSIIFTKVVEVSGQEYVVMVNGGITPINATVSTLRRQLVIISLILMLAIVVFTLLLYRGIGRPLIRINEAAKTLPKGEYTAQEGSGQYREADELNSTLTQAAADIRKADKAKRDLIANVSHDLRTPLTMIGGYGEMMRDLPEEKTDENLDVIIQESKRLTHLVNDLLDLSRIQEQTITLNRTDFDISSMLEREMKKYDVYRMQEGYQIEADIPADIHVSADEARIAQVFNNFMNNAISYCGENRHIIVRMTQENGKARISVQDFGEGIAEEDLANIWDRYYKVDKTHVRPVSGSGIGLAIVKEILEMHHAAYGVNSTLHEGSTFWFELPLSN